MANIKDAIKNSIKDMIESEEIKIVADEDGELTLSVEQDEDEDSDD